MLVSVIIPAYNQDRYLAEAVQSALDQTLGDLEVIVVDDGSTDNTRDVVSRFKDPRLRYLYQENRGLSAARNTGIRAARGSFLTFLDSDDAFVPQKLELLVAAFEGNAELGMAAGQAILIDEDGEPFGEVFDRALPQDTSEWLLGNPLHVGSVLLRREWQARAGFFDESLHSYEDWDLWLRLARSGCPMGWVARPVSLYRSHDAQMTRAGEQMTAATFAVLEKTYREPDLPEAWRARRNDAYSRAFLRAAAQAYSGRDFSRARSYMREAVRLSPDLCAGAGERLASLAAGWANHVKTREPLALLESVYDHLPEELNVLRWRRRRDLARQALDMAFAAYARGDAGVARSFLCKAAGYRPQIFLNRGVVSVFLRVSLAGCGATMGRRVVPRQARSKSPSNASRGEKS